MDKFLALRSLFFESKTLFYENTCTATGVNSAW